MKYILTPTLFSKLEEESILSELEHYAQTGECYSHEDVFGIKKQNVN